MRELTKSTFSAGLAMSLFGMQTMINVFRRPPPGGPNPAQGALDAVTQAMVDQTGGTLREVFQAGDKVQRELIDLTFQFLTLAPLRPSGGVSALTGATERVGKWIGDLAASGGQCRGGTCSAPPSPGAAPAPPPSQPWVAAPPGTGWGPVSNQP